MAFDDSDDSFEHTLMIVREVNAFKVPPRATSGGYKCAEWLVSDKIWTGRLRLVSRKEKCDIRLEDSNTGELFASCPVKAGERESAVESVTDSSRYFVLRLDDGRGRHAFIGLGFNERNEAFDFNVALSDHEKHVLAENEKAQQPKESSQGSNFPSVDLKLKEGETIRINMKSKLVSSGTGAKKLSTSNLSGGVSSIASVGAMKAPLAPPPGGIRTRRPIPPPTNDTSKSRVGSNMTNTEGRHSKDPFQNMSLLESALPGSKSTTGSSNISSTASGWAAF